MELRNVEADNLAIEVGSETAEVLPMTPKGYLGHNGHGPDLDVFLATPAGGRIESH